MDGRDKVPDLPILRELDAGSRKKFWELYTKPEHELSDGQIEELNGFEIDQRRLEHEHRCAEVNKASEVWCVIKGRRPFTIETRFGDLTIPDGIVPQELLDEPDQDSFTARLTAELSDDFTGRVTSVSFVKFPQKYTRDELRRLGTPLSEAPAGKWGREKK